MAKEAPQTPSSLSAPIRSTTSKFTTQWSLPSGASSGDKAYDKQTVHWRVLTSSLKTDSKTEKKKWSSDGERSIGNHDVSKSTKTNNITIDRKAFYPLKSKRLREIKVAVEAKNNCGSAQTGWKSLKFSVPQKPSISIDYDDGQGLVTIEISAPTTDKKDRYWCDYHVYRTDIGGSSSYYGKTKRIALDRNAKPLSNHSTKASFKLYHNAEAVYLADGASITITVDATSRGFAGDSETATKSLTITSPLRPQITKVDLSNKDTLSLIRNLASKQFNNGCVRVFYKSAEGAPTANYDNNNPDVYTLERAITPWKVNTVYKADVYPDWISGIDTNAGSTSESNKAYRLTRKRYSDFKYVNKKKAKYYTAYDKKVKKTTKVFGAWKLDAYKSATYKVGSKSVKRYTSFKVKKTVNLKVFKAYDKKQKKWIKNIPAYNYAKYKKATYATAKKTVKRYKSFTKTGTRLVKMYKAKDNKTGKTKTGIPEWKLSTLKTATYQEKKTHATAVNPADGVMGEPITDVFRDMGFTVSGGVYDKRVWYRIKVERFGIVEYSQAFEAAEFRAPAPSISHDYSGFMRIIQNPKNPGTSIIGTVGWNNADKTDEGVDNPNWKDATWTTLVKWSGYHMAEQSNQKASELEIDWKNSAKVHKIRQTDYVKMVKKGLFSARQGAKTLTNAIKWKSSADFAIYGLEPGVPVYLWTQRHMVLGEFDLLGPKSQAPASPKGYYPFTPTDDPTQIAVYLPEYYVYGEDLSVSWTHNATCDQKSWTIYAFAAEDVHLAKYTAGTTNAASIPKKMIASGTGKTTFTTISADILKNIMGKNACVYNGTKAFSIVKHLGIIVGVSTGGAEILSFANSKKKYVDTDPMRIVHKPTAALYNLPAFKEISHRRVLLFTNTTGVDGVVNVYARDDVTRYLPDRTWHQSTGECVWNMRVESTRFKKIETVLASDAAKTADLENYVKNYQYVALIDIPPSIDTLFDGGRYRIEAYTLNPDASQYKSDTQVREVTCDYSHKPSPPGRRCRVEAVDNGSYLHGYEFDYLENGRTVRGHLTDGSTMSKSVADEMSLPPTAMIYCAVPEKNYKPSDRCRVYRVTPDGAEVIADDVAFEQIVIDRYAPFSKTADTRYIIATKTAMGVIESREVRYSLKRHGMRFDWGDYNDPHNVELPFDIQLNASYEKNVRVDSYIDGTSQAHFNAGFSKTESVSTKLVRLQNPYQFELVRQLGQYPGTVFYRAHDGSAYECVCKVSGLPNNFDELTSSISLELTRVTTSDRFKPRLEDVVSSL